MGNDTINFRNSAVWFPFGCIAALVTPALVYFQADLRRRPSASGRSKLTGNSFDRQRMLGGISLPPRVARRRDTSGPVGSFIALTGTRKENG
jgi:hypothetical protein